MTIAMQQWTDGRVIEEYRGYLERWNARDIGRKVEIARDFLYHQGVSLDELTLEEIGSYKELVKQARVEVVSFWRFVQRMQQRESDPYVQLDRRLSGLEEVEQVWMQRYIGAMRRQNLRVETIQGNVSRICGFIEQLPGERRGHLEEVSGEDIAAYIEGCQDAGNSPGTVNRKLVTVASFYHRMEEAGLAGRCPVVRKWHLLRVDEDMPRWMRREDVRRLFEQIQGIQDRAIFMTLWKTGMRVGELMRLRMGDLDLGAHRILVGERAKGRKARVVYISWEGQEALEAWLEEREGYQIECVFFPSGRESWSYSGIRQKFVRYREAAGMDSFYTIHSLRHTYATELHGSGVSLEALQRLLGHSNLRETQRYARTSEQRKREEYFAAMDRIEKGGIGDDVSGSHLPVSTVSEAEELFPGHGTQLRASVG